MCKPAIKLLSVIIYFIFITVVGGVGGVILSDMYGTPVIESVVGCITIMYILNCITR